MPPPTASPHPMSRTAAQQSATSWRRGGRTPGRVRVCHSESRVPVNLTRIYTRHGDGGETHLGDMSRVPKTHPRIEAYGDVDELNAQLGVALATDGLPDAYAAWLRRIQNDLFDLGADLAVPPTAASATGCASCPRRSRGSRSAATRSTTTLEPLKSFVLPGGTRAAAQLHVCRTVCRRAERARARGAGRARPTSSATSTASRTCCSSSRAAPTTATSRSGSPAQGASAGQRRDRGRGPRPGVQERPARRRRHRPARLARRDLRLPGAQRRGQVDDGAHAHDAAAADRRARRASAGHDIVREGAGRARRRSAPRCRRPRSTRCSPAASTCGCRRRSTACPAAERRAARRRAARARRAARRGRPQGRRLLGRHEAPPGPRARARPPPAHPLPRRADDRPRSAEPLGAVGGGRPPGPRGRRHRLPHHAVPRGGRRPRRPHRDHRSRAHRRRAARRTR